MLEVLCCFIHVEGENKSMKLSEKGLKPTEENKAKKSDFFPNYDNLHVWEFYPDALKTEYRQLWEEGADVAAYQSLFDSVSELKRSRYKEQLGEILFHLSLDLPQREGYPYREPSDLEGIRALCKPYHLTGKKVDQQALREQIAGAWYGRICDCLSGKPVEGMRSHELAVFLKETGNYPMRRYMLHADVTKELIDRLDWGIDNACAYADQIPCAPVDDDTNYTVMYQKVIEEYGREFTPRNVADAWIKYQPKSAYCTAERVAFRNFLLGYDPPDSARYQNPYREWIGAQIRGDYFGYINPGNPDLAAEMAWRDASISHTKNGIYGEMYVASMLAAAAICDRMEDVIEVGLAHIPATSRLYEAIRDILTRYQAGEEAQTVFADIAGRWDENDWHCWTHTISNAEIVTAALLYGKGDYSLSVGMAVQIGFDTDCNGATVGSVIGLKNGLSAIPPAWLAPVNGKLETSLFGVNTVEIEDLIAKTMEHIK